MRTSYDIKRPQPARGVTISPSRHTCHWTRLTSRSALRAHVCSGAVGQSEEMEPAVAGAVLVRIGATFHVPLSCVRAPTPESVTWRSSMSHIGRFAGDLSRESLGACERPMARRTHQCVVSAAVNRLIVPDGPQTSAVAQKLRATGMSRIERFVTLIQHSTCATSRRWSRYRLKAQALSG